MAYEEVCGCERYRHHLVKNPASSHDLCFVQFINSSQPFCGAPFFPNLNLAKTSISSQIHRSAAEIGFSPLQKELPSKKDCPHMCAYKLVTVKFKWWGLQNKVENFIQKVGFQTGCPSPADGRSSFIPSLLPFSLSPSLSSAAREAPLHQLPPPAVLLDRQVDRLEHGGHPPHGGGDAQGAGRSEPWEGGREGLRWRLGCRFLS